MITGDQIAESARRYIGTPYVQNGRLKGIGVDCVGLVICAINDAGGSVDAFIGPTDGDYIEAVIAGVAAHADEVEPAAMLPGDVLVFRSAAMPQHMGVCVSGSTFVHSYDSPTFSCAIEDSLEPRWSTRIYKVFRYRGEA